MRKAVTTLQSLSMLYGPSTAEVRGVEEVRLLRNKGGEGRGGRRWGGGGRACVYGCVMYCSWSCVVKGGTRLTLRHAFQSSELMHSMLGLLWPSLLLRSNIVFTHM